MCLFFKKVETQPSRVEYELTGVLVILTKFVTKGPGVWWPKAEANAQRQSKAKIVIREED